jgi:hypothetical protein
MPRVMVNDVLCQELDTFTTPVEVCDHSGRVLGQFIPAGQSTTISVPSDGCPYSDDELTAMRNETGGRPLAEIWKSLGRA